MSIDFAQAMTRATGITENGAVTNISSGSNLVDLFFLAGASRQKSASEIVSIFYAAANEDLKVAVRILLWARDVRGGAGERRFFREVLKELAKLGDFGEGLAVAKRVLVKVPEIGRWDDVLVIFETDNKPLKRFVAKEMIWPTLNSANGALVAKWMPRKKAPAAEIRTILGVSPKAWRKTLVENNNVVETKMCEKRFGDIKFSEVPSLAAARYRNAFRRNAPDEFGDYVAALNSGEAKINASAMFPHDVVRGATDYFLFGVSHNIDAEQRDYMARQWESLPDALSESNDLTIVPVSDVSGSMHCPVSGSVKALDISVGLGIYVAERNRGPFHNMMVTFSSRPRVFNLHGDIADKMATVMGEVGYNTDVEAVFNLILSKLQNENLGVEDVPDSVLMFSDMEFDAAHYYTALRHASGGAAHRVQNRRTLFQKIRDKWDAAGYPMPKLVFWNLNSRSSNNFPAVRDEEGAVMVSGFSPSVMKSILSADFDRFTPENIMLDTVMVPRYDW